MAFSFDWFLTVPGILISSGVILLIIALILFVVSSMKEKKGETAPSILEDNGMMNSEPNNIGMNNTTVNPTEVNNFGMNNATVNPAEVNNFGMNNATVNPTEVNNFGMNNATVNPAEVNNFGMNNATVNPTEVNNNVVMDQTQINPTPEIQPVVDIPPFVETNNTINVDIPVVETPLIAPVSDEVIVPSFEGDSIIPPVQENQNNMIDSNSFVSDDFGEMIVPAEPTVNNQNNNPVETANNSGLFEIPEPVVEVEQRPIYGGADPLEATQTLPRMDVHHEPYSGGAVEVIPTVIEETMVQPMNQFNEQPVQPEIVQDIPVQPMTITNSVDSLADETSSIVSIPDDIEEL